MNVLVTCFFSGNLSISDCLQIDTTSILVKAQVFAAVKTWAALSLFWPKVGFFVRFVFLESNMTDTNRQKFPLILVCHCSVVWGHFQVFVSVHWKNLPKLWFIHLITFRMLTFSLLPFSLPWNLITTPAISPEFPNSPLHSLHSGSLMSP